MSLNNLAYDSVESCSDEENNITNSVNSNLDSESHSDSGSLIFARQEGDGQESVSTKKVDDDEDKKNPQYIPKKGTFYEHDDRTVEEEEIENEPEKEKEDKKKIWQDKKDRWSHDKFIDLEQAPKSRAELVAIYGYDIRNEEGPPRARRRRRYGRGPNKYTRTWEDENAYIKTISTNTRNKKRPPAKKIDNLSSTIKLQENKSNCLDETQVMKSQTETEDKSLSGESLIKKRNDQSYNRKNLNKIEHLTKSAKEGDMASSELKNIFQNTSNSIGNSEILNTSQRINSGRVAKIRREIKDSDHRGFTTKTLQLRPIKNEKQKILPSRNQQHSAEIPSRVSSKDNDNYQEIEKEMKKLSLDVTNKIGKRNEQDNNYTHQRQTSVPPRLLNEPKGSKRYSSMRQRSLPETNNPPAVSPFPLSGYYSNDYKQQQSDSSTPSTSVINQGSSIHRGAQISPQSIPIQQVTAAPLLQAPFPQGYPQPSPAFISPGAAPAGFIPTQPPPIINYVQGQPPFTSNYQGYQQPFSHLHELSYSNETHFSPAITDQLQTTPSELYQPQGGITYYSTDQQVTQRPIAQKRPKVAIPIVAPPKDDNEIEQPHLYAEDSEGKGEIPK